MSSQLLRTHQKLAATVTAPSSARRFVRATLESWLLHRLVDDALVITSELVTNAVNATGITKPNPTYTDLENLSILAVQVRVTGMSLFIEVWDDDPDEPTGEPPAPLSEGESPRVGADSGSSRIWRRAWA